MNSPKERLPGCGPRRLSTASRWGRLALSLALVDVLSFAGCASTGSQANPSSPALAVSPASIGFWNVIVGRNSTQTITLTNMGSSSVSVSQISVSGAGFSTSGLTPPLTLMAGQSTALSVIFAPASAGSATGSVTVVSNATNSPTTIALSGTGVQPISHSVTLTWSPSTSVVVGYNVYRGAQSGGPYTKLNSSPISITTYTDTTVLAGQTYFFVSTAVDSNNVESVFSNEVSAAIPTP